MVGDKGWLSVPQEMNILPRPYKWETGNTLPKQYERLAEKLLQKTARNEKRNSAALMIAVGGFTLLIDIIRIVSLLLGSGHSIRSAAFFILWNAFAAFIIYRLFDYKQIGALSGDLQSGSFRWRTGKLDEIAAEVVGYRGGDDDPSKPVLSVFAYAARKAPPRSEGEILLLPSRAGRFKAPPSGLTSFAPPGADKAKREKRRGQNNQAKVRQYRADYFGHRKRNAVSGS